MHNAAKEENDVTHTVSHPAKWLGIKTLCLAYFTEHGRCGEIQLHPQNELPGTRESLWRSLPFSFIFTLQNFR